MKRVWLMLKILESILGLCCLGYHIRGFLNNDYIEDHYISTAIFGGFSLMTMFGCLSICITHERVGPLWEGFCNLIASVAFISVSINSMDLAKNDLNLMSEEQKLEMENESAQPLSIFQYSKAQSVAALWCGTLFLLHSIFAFDFAFFDDSTTDMEESDDDDEDESGTVQYLFLYVFGKNVHGWLDKFEYFNSLADKQKQFTREELLVQIKMEDM